MGKEELSIQLEHSFARLAKTEVTRFDDACVDRTNRNFKETFAISSNHFIFAIATNLEVGIKTFQQRMETIGEAFVKHQRTQIRMVFRNETKHIVKFAFIPSCCRKNISQARIVQITICREFCLNSIYRTFFFIIEQAIDSKTATALGFICAEHSCQRMLATVTANISSAT